MEESKTASREVMTKSKMKRWILLCLHIVILERKITANLSHTEENERRKEIIYGSTRSGRAETD